VEAVRQEPDDLLESREAGADPGDGELYGQGAQETLIPLERLNVDVVQKAAALRYQVW